MTDMELSEILNIVFGTGFIATIVGLLGLRSKLRQVKAEAEEAIAKSDTLKITNTEQATKILMENIVKPLKEELNETRKELIATRRESAKLRKAITEANHCDYSDDCPVLKRMRQPQGESDDDAAAPVQPDSGQHDRRDRKKSKHGKGASVGGPSEDPD